LKWKVCLATALRLLPLCLFITFEGRPPEDKHVFLALENEVRTMIFYCPHKLNNKKH
jgi:hypothetical protein